MRLGVVSDIHGNLRALEAVVEDLGRRGVTAVVNLGDCATGPLWPRETIDLLMSKNWPTVRGNHDRWLTNGQATTDPMVSFTREALGSEHIDWIATLPHSLTQTDVLAVHGTISSDEEYLLEESFHGRLALASRHKVAGRLGYGVPSLVLCGHSHRQGSAEIGKTLIVNPGSVGVPRYVDSSDPRLAEAGSRRAHYSIVTRLGGEWHVEQIALPYTWTDAADRARRTGHQDWELRFRTDDV